MESGDRDDAAGNFRVDIIPNEPIYLCDDSIRGDARCGAKEYFDGSTTKEVELTVDLSDDMSTITIITPDIRVLTSGARDIQVDVDRAIEDTPLTTFGMKLFYRQGQTDPFYGVVPEWGDWEYVHLRPAIGVIEGNWSECWEELESEDCTGTGCVEQVCKSGTTALAMDELQSAEALEYQVHVFPITEGELADLFESTPGTDFDEGTYTAYLQLY